VQSQSERPGLRGRHEGIAGGLLQLCPRGVGASGGGGYRAEPEPGIGGARVGRQIPVSVHFSQASLHLQNDGVLQQLRRS